MNAGGDGWMLKEAVCDPTGYRPILNADALMRPVWTEFLANLAPLPASADPEALRPEDCQGPREFVRGLRPAVKPGFLPGGNSMPAWYFDLCNVESHGRETVENANAALTQSFRNGVTDRTNVGSFQSCQSPPRL